MGFKAWEAVGNSLIGMEGYLLETLTKVKRTLDLIRRLGPLWSSRRVLYKNKYC